MRNIITRLFFSVISTTLSSVHAKRTSLPAVLDDGFWFSNVTVGNQTFSLIVDTGSDATNININLYKPGPEAKNTSESLFTSYTTTTPDGTGESSFAWWVFNDTLSLDGVGNFEAGIGDVYNWSGMPYQHDGILGLSKLDAWSDDSTNPVWLSACNQSKIESCKFAVAFGENGEGSLVFGNEDPSMYQGSLTSISSDPDLKTWSSSKNDTAFVVNGTRLSPRELTFDCGTSNLFVGDGDVEDLLEKAGGFEIHKAYDAKKNLTSITGTYNCSKPPSMGLSIAGRTFDIGPQALKLNSTGDNCTANILGQVNSGVGWSVGQAFFQGKYVEHDPAKGLAFGLLR